MIQSFIRLTARDLRCTGPELLRLHLARYLHVATRMHRFDALSGSVAPPESVSNRADLSVSADNLSPFR